MTGSGRDHIPRRYPGLKRPRHLGSIKLGFVRAAARGQKLAGPQAGSNSHCWLR